jgi:hypothetical protein
VQAIDGASRRRYFRCAQKAPAQTGTINMWIVRVLCWLALLAGPILLSLDGANAQGSSEAQQACTGDAMRLCADAIPDVPKVTACMKAKYRQLSAPCRLVMAGGGNRVAGGNHVGGGNHLTHLRQARAGRCDPFTHMCN